MHISLKSDDHDFLLIQFQRSTAQQLFADLFLLFLFYWGIICLLAKLHSFFLLEILKGASSAAISG